MYTRGQFAVIGKIGRKALRIYEDKGILVPAEEDPENGYHYYAPEQLQDLFTIQQYKKYGLSLDEIADILVHGVDEKEILEEHSVELGNEIQDGLRRKNQLESHLRGLDKGKEQQKYGFDVCSFEEKNVIFRKENIDKEKLGVSVGKLHEEAAYYELPISGAHFVQYENLNNDEGLIGMIVCLPVMQSQEQNDDNMISTMSVYFEKAIHTVHKTGFSTTGLAHEAVLKYISDNNFATDGRAIERYNPDYTVDIYYSIK